MSSHALSAASPDWLVGCQNLEELLNGSEFRVLKATSRTLAGIARINGVEVFVKRVTSASWSKGIATRVFGSRARKTIRGARILQRGRFLHPRVIAAFEQRNGGSIRASYVIAEYLRRPKVLSRFALADGRDFRWRQQFSGQLAETIRTLHDAGCYTRDLQETNLMIEAKDGVLRVYFTDVEDFRRRLSVPRRIRLFNLIHLDRSIGRFVSRSHRLRFLYNYAYDGRKPCRAERHTLVAQVLRIRQRIERRQCFRQPPTAIVMPPPERRRNEGNVSIQLSSRAASSPWRDAERTYS